MRFLVKKGAHGDTHVVPCSDSSVSVKKLKRSIVARLWGEDEDCEGYSLRLAGSGAVVDDQDTVGDVLQDGDCLSLSSDSEQLLKYCASC